MDESEVRALFDEQMRRDPAAEPGAVVDRDGRITPVLGPPGWWRGVTWSDLSGSDANVEIDDQIGQLSPYGDWEWKLYSYDQPTDLSDRLVAAGLLQKAAETVLVAALDELDCPWPPAGVQLVPVVDHARGADSVVAVHDEVFGGRHNAIREVLTAGIQASSAAAVLAVATESLFQRDGWSSQKAGTSPASGAEARWRHGGDVGSSVPWSLTEQRSVGDTADTATCK